MPASDISTAPLADCGRTNTGALLDYGINRVISKWMRENSTRQIWRNFCQSEADWEEWAECELEVEFRDMFGLLESLRGVDDVYTSKKVPNLVLPQTAEQKGMVIELRCENALGQVGTKLTDLASSSTYTRPNITDKYSDYVFAVLVLAFTDEADKFLKEVSMELIPGAAVPVATPNMMKMYRKDFHSQWLNG